MKKTFTKFAIFTGIWFVVWSIINRRYIADPGLRAIFTYGGYLWALIIWAYSGRRMHRKYGDAEKVLEEVERNLDAMQNNASVKSYIARQNEEAEYRETLEYKYEVLDSMSIRQIERYLETRKNSSGYEKF